MMEDLVFIVALSRLVTDLVLLCAGAMAIGSLTVLAMQFLAPRNDRP